MSGATHGQGIPGDCGGPARGWHLYCLCYVFLIGILLKEKHKCLIALKNVSNLSLGMNSRFYTGYMPEDFIGRMSTVCPLATTLKWNMLLSAGST